MKAFGRRYSKVDNVSRKGYRGQPMPGESCFRCRQQPSARKDCVRLLRGRSQILGRLGVARDYSSRYTRRKSTTLSRPAKRYHAMPTSFCKMLCVWLVCPRKLICGVWRCSVYAIRERRSIMHLSQDAASKGEAHSVQVRRKQDRTVVEML
jgi:hypothetical protein